MMRSASRRDNVPSLGRANPQHILHRNSYERDNFLNHRHIRRTHSQTVLTRPQN